MVKKEENIQEEIKTLIEKDKLVFGADRTVKLVKQGQLSRILMTSNINPSLKKDLEHYKDVSGVELVELEYSQDQLGVICKKPFPISVIGILK